MVDVPSHGVGATETQVRQRADDFVPDHAGVIENSSFETFKQGGKAVGEAAEQTGQQAANIYDQAKGAGDWAKLRDHSSYHTDTLADRIMP